MNHPRRMASLLKRSREAPRSFIQIVHLIGSLPWVIDTLLHCGAISLFLGTRRSVIRVFT